MRSYQTKLQMFTMLKKWKQFGFSLGQIGEGKSTNDILLNFQGRNRDLLPLLRATKKSLKRRLREEHRLMKELSERIERKVGAS